jgi:hypothetical protein
VAVLTEGPKRISAQGRDAPRIRLSRLLYEIRTTLQRQAYPESAFLIIQENFLPVLEAHFRSNRWWAGGERFSPRGTS